jgi:hypothetical protein
MDGKGSQLGDLDVWQIVPQWVWSSFKSLESENKSIPCLLSICDGYQTSKHFYITRYL